MFISVVCVCVCEQLSVSKRTKLKPNSISKSESNPLHHSVLAFYTVIYSVVFIIN